MLVNSNLSHDTHSLPHINLSQLIDLDAATYVWEDLLDYIAEHVGENSALLGYIKVVSFEQCCFWMRFVFDVGDRLICRLYLQKLHYTSLLPETVGAEGGVALCVHVPCSSSWGKNNGPKRSHQQVSVSTYISYPTVILVPFCSLVCFGGTV
jgi:hypothetical protein